MSPTSSQRSNFGLKALIPKDSEVPAQRKKLFDLTNVKVKKVPQVSISD